jgi:hypothetical protein
VSVIEKREPEEAEGHDRPEITRETPEQRVAIVVRPKSLRDANQRFVARDRSQLNRRLLIRRHHPAV